MLKSAWVRSLLRFRVHFGHSNIVLHCPSVFGMLFTEHNHSLPHSKPAPGLALSPRFQITQITSGIPTALSPTDKFLLVLSSKLP